MRREIGIRPVIFYHFLDLQIEFFAVGEFNVLRRSEGSHVEYLAFSYIDFVARQVVVAIFFESFLRGDLCPSVLAREKDTEFFYILYVDSFFSK